MALIVTTPSGETETPQEIGIDLVSLKEGTEKIVQIVPRTKRLKPKTDLRTTKPETKINIKAEAPEAGPPNENYSIGQSEIESDVDGRLPRNDQERYLVNVRDRVTKQQRYPRPSQVFKEEGLIKIRISLNQEGALTKVELLQPSPFSRLNDAAMKAVSEAAPFPRFPDEIQFRTWKITVPIRFIISRN